MPPGDPPTPINQATGAFGEQNSAYKYYSKDDWFVERIINYNEISSEVGEVLEAARYWKRISDDLVRKGYPYCEGIGRIAHLDEDTIWKGRMLDDFLDTIINKKSIQQSSTYEKLRILVAQGDDFNVFKSKMKKLDFSTKCNEIWENDAVAYRCNTCALSPCMSLCETCFDQNGHKGHDFTRFFSREGGACDCGNADVIKTTGFCNRHGDRDGKPEINILDVSLPSFIITKLIVRLFLEWRGWYNRASTAMRLHDEQYPNAHGANSFNIGLHCDNDVLSAKLLINFIQECVNFGGPMRDIVAKLLIDEDLYTSLTEKTSDYTGEDDRGDVSLDWRTQKLFYDDRTNLLFDEDDEVDFPDLSTIDSLTCKTLLDEMLFWVIRQIFPQNLVNLSLSMLSEIDYRDAYAIRFFTWYPLIGKLIRELCRFQDDHSRTSDHRVQNTCSRIIHVSVQMLSSGVLCKTLNEKCRVVKSVCAITSYLLCERIRLGYIILDPRFRFCSNEDEISRYYESTWHNMQCEYNSSITHHGYWFVMGDMQNLLSHETIAIDTVLDDETFVGIYVPMLKKMQAMHEMWRIVLGPHQETDAIDVVQQAYTLEFETLAVTLFNIVTSIQRNNHSEAAIRFFDAMYAALKDWFDNIVPRNAKNETILCQVYAVSFHLPIHRHLSTALTHFQKIAGFREHVAETLLYDENVLRLTILHPLRIQVAREEIACGMWARNGGEARIATLIYAQANVNNAFQIPDIDLIRYCAAHVDKEWLMSTFLSTFYLDEKIEIERSLYSKKLAVRLKLYSGVDLNAVDPLVESPAAEFSEYQEYLKDMDKIEFIISHFDGDLPVESFVLEEEREKFKGLMSWRNNCTTMILGSGDEKNVRINTKMIATARDARRDAMEVFREILLNRTIENMEQLIANMEQEDDTIATTSQRPVSEEEKAVNMPVLLRSEWMDAMICGMFKVLAEIIVIRVNSGASLEEQYRTEMINYLSSANMTHSKLRSYITEKGSRGNEPIDLLFDKILNEIADFIEPDYNISQSSMHQGIYCLKQEILEKETCPIFCILRASNQKIISDLFEKLSALDRNAVTTMENYKDLKFDNSFWPPFRLIDFDKNLRHEGISNLYSTLLTEHLILSCIASLHYSFELKMPLHENAIELAVYLLTLGVKYAAYLLNEEKDEETKLYLQQIYHTPFKIKRNGSEEYSVYTVFSYIFKLFASEAKRLENFIPLLKKVLNGDFDTERIYGGASIYLARFLTILVKLSPTCRRIVEQKLRSEEIELLKLNHQSELLDAKKQAARDSSKRRQMMILEQAKRRNEQMMAKMMKAEGMSKEEVDRIDTKQLLNVPLYDCPICGENSSPNTLNSPFGMFARFSTNFLAEEQKSYLCDETSLLLDVNSISRREMQSPWRTRRSFIESRRVLEETKPEFSLQFSPTTGTDLKTCGHAAHISCFNAYRMSVSESRGRETRDIGCPLCRFTINTIVPITLDHDEASEMWQRYGTGGDFFDIFKDCVKVALRRHPIVSVKEAFEEHYSSKEGGALRDIVQSRKRTSDTSERQLCDPRLSSSSTLLAMATATVERSSILRWNNVAEKRKNARKVLTEHLLSSSVACIPENEAKVALSVACQLMGDEKCAPSGSSQESETAKPVNLSKTPQKIAGLDEEAIRCLTETSIPKRSEFIDHKSVPLLMFEPRTIFTRLVSLIVNNWELSRTDKGAMCHNLLKHFVQCVSVRGTLLLLLRVGSEKLKGFEEGTYQIPQLFTPLDSLPRLVANALKNCGEQFYASLLQSMESTDDNILYLESDDDFVELLHRYILNFIAFALEMLHHVNIYTEDGVKMLHRPKMMIRNALYLSKINAKNLIPEEQKIQEWIRSFETTISWNFRISSQPLSTEPLVWKTRRILELPREYNQLFSAYFHRECLACSKAPSNPMICLMCSRLVCLDDCCKLLSTDHTHGREAALVTEIEKHAEECSSSSGVFLSLNSSLIIIVRGRQAAIWGSVYLDGHGEEDRNLKRGKPLSLSERRFECLENDWLDQEWQRVHVWMQMTNNTLISAIRDSHHHF